MTTATEDADDLGYAFQRGGSFILDASDRPPAWWGSGDNIIGAEGEALLIAGPQGTGKSTIAQQQALGLAGFPEYAELLGYPIRPTTGRVLYLAMDRPRQIARSLRRMVGEAWRAELDDRLVIWPGPPPGDLAKHPGLLTSMAQKAGATHVIVDSLKDAAVGIIEDEVGAAWNRARQTALQAGIDLTELHHPRKADKTGKEKPGVDSIYGSTWITAGAGSILLMVGDPGEPIVDVYHVKQPMNDVGPIKVLHDNTDGRTTVWEATDLQAVAKASGQLSAVGAACALFDTEKPTPSEKERARRRLDSLTRSGHLMVLDEGDKATNSPRLWGAAA